MSDDDDYGEGAGDVRGNLYEAEMRREAAKRNWPEDSQHENGNYDCRCCMCGLWFIGHKRRIVCKACHTPSQTQDDTP